VLGEVVAGAKAAKQFRLGPGARLRTDLANVYNLSGAYPYVLEVVGVLEPTGTDDDDAFFVDLKTTWVLDGTVHGHTTVTAEQAVDNDGEQDGNLEASAAIFLAQEITSETRASFHLHGDPEALPVTGFVVLPDDVRRHDQLLGALALDDDLAAVRPVEVVRSVLGIVLHVQEGLELAFALVAAATTGFFVLVLSLTLRLRDAELRLLRRLGCSRTAVAWIVGAEITIIALTAAIVAGASAWVAASHVALTLQ
jgi:putative ABC transport system permease protein